MSGKFTLAPGVDIDWEGGATYDAVLNNFAERGGQPGWRPHFRGDVERLLYEMDQSVFIEGKEIPPAKIPEAGYPELTIDNDISVADLERELFPGEFHGR